jgi:hypothetical protein
MVMLSAYMDETGHSRDEKQRFNGMAGLMAPAKRWRRMERKWKRTLQRFRVPYFHMKDFANFHGHYKGWSETKRRDLYRCLLAHIEGTRPFPVGSILKMEDYRAFVAERGEAIFDDPYHIGFGSVIVYLSTTMNAIRPAGERVALVFSDQVEFRNSAMRDYGLLVDVTEDDDLAVISNRTEWPIFRDMKELVQLQAADIVAYELYKEFERQEDRPHVEPRHGYKELCRMSLRLGLDAPMFAFHTKESIAGGGEMRWASGRQGQPDAASS